ncbi:MAG: type II secretion system F family protein [Arachnia sp.]
MDDLVAPAVGACLTLGVLLLVQGWRRVPRRVSTHQTTGMWTTLRQMWTTLPQWRRITAVSAVVAGVAVAPITGWLLAAVLLPAAAVVIPSLLAEPPQREIALLAGLDRWVRLLGPSIATGKSIRDAIIVTRGQVPEVLTEPVSRLVARLDQGWTTREALLQTADEVSSADADAVLAAMALSASRGGIGTRSTLSALSQTIQDRLRALREIAAERAKPRAVVKQVTLITLIVLGGALVLGRSFFTPYTTPIGQVIALSLAAAYLGSLIMLRRRTTTPPTPRFLRGESA